MSALSDLQEAADAIIAFVPGYSSGQQDLASQYNNIDPEAADAQEQFDALEQGPRVALQAVNKDYNALISKMKSLSAAAIAEDATAANALVNSIETLIAPLRGVVTNVANSIKAAITKAVTEKNKSEDTTEPDATKAPLTADGDKTGDNTESGPTTNKSSTTNSGTTTAGAAGNNSTSSDPSSIIGKRKYNPLGDFSSYTYKIALYMMNPSEFNAYMSGDYTKIKGAKLIVQSGGINASLDSPRASGFDLDLYIDDLEILTKVNNKETLSATNSCEFKFKIYEPYGFSFPHTLIKAQVASQAANNASQPIPTGANAQIVALNQNFLLVIKFYGYDKDGKLITSSDYPQADISKTDTQSVFERGFPIKINDFKFKLENKVTVYSISAVPSSDRGKSVDFGTLPTNMTLAGETIQDVLIGAGQNTTKKSIMGMVQSLNAYEEQRVKDGFKTYNHVYAIEFENGIGMGDALLVPKEYYVKERVPFNSIQNPDGSNERTAWKNRFGNIAKEIRTVELQAGTPVIQAIDKIITQSEYLKNMMTAIDKEIDQTVKDTDSTVDKNPNPKTLSWYNISNTIKIKSDKRDPQTNEYAYYITYKIQDYKVPYIRSVYTSKTSSYYGPHKVYNYWYTGKNTEILSYEQDFNLLYRLDAAAASSAATQNLQSASVSYKSGINTDSDNSKSGTNDVINSVKSFLYSPNDLLKFKLKILGDPDYLMPSVGLAGKNGLEKWYGDNFTINPNSGQVFIEIYFEQAEDYNNTSGLLVPNGDIQFMNYPAELKNKVKGMVYMLTNVTSTFSKGKFEQSLTGIIPEFAKGGGTTTSPPATPNTRTGDNTPAASTSNTNSDNNEVPPDNSTSSGTTTEKSGDTTTKEILPTTTDQGTSPTGGTTPPPAPPSPPALVLPHPSPTARTTFAGAMIKAYMSGTSLFVPVFLPSGLELANVRGWGASQWDGLIARADPRDLEALTSLKANYDTVIQPLVTEVETKIAENDTARKEHNELLSNWGKTAGTGTSTPTGRVADDDSGR